MANDLVVNIGAKLDKFSADMDQAGDIADNAVGRIERSFANLNPGVSLGSLTAVVAGAAAGFTALLGIVGSLNKGLSDMADQAQRIGISAQRFQELQFAGSSLGVKNTGDQLESFSQNVQSALTRVNDLKRVFDANGQSITDGNGKIRDMAKLLDTAFDIVKRAPSISDALQIGGFLGFSKDLSQQLFNAGDSFQTLASQARDMGVVIDQETIDKAQQFTREWDKAASVWGVSMKASMAEWLPLLNDAIKTAQTLIGYVTTVTGALAAVKGFAVSAFGGQSFDADKASLAELEKRGETLIRIRDKLNDQSTTTKNVLGAEVEVKANPLTPTESFVLGQVVDDKGTPIQESVQKNIDLIADRIVNFNKDPAKKIVITSDRPSVNPGLKRAGEDDAPDNFDRQVDALTKRTAILQADTATTFQNTTAQAQLRAEFALLTAIVRDEGEVTQEQLDRYTQLRASMSQTQALQAAGIELTKEHGEQFASASQKIASATESFTKARETLHALNAASQAVGSALAGSFADAVLEGKKLDEVFSNLLKQLARLAINAAFNSIFSAGSGGGTSPILSFFGIGKNAEGTDNWRGGLTMVGERGPELVNLPKGSQVIPNHALGSLGGGDRFNFAPQIDARGADVAAVARLEQILIRQQQEFANNVITTVRKAKTTRVL